LTKTILNDLFGLEELLQMESECFLTEMVDQVCNFNSGTGHANVVFAIGRALKGHINNEGEKIFGVDYSFDVFIGPQIKLLTFTNFTCNHIEKQSTAGQYLD
jgi:hypothetical protein